jgi:hypothetical protein
MLEFTRFLRHHADPYAYVPNSHTRYHVALLHLAINLTLQLPQHLPRCAQTLTIPINRRDQAAINSRELALQDLNIAIVLILAACGFIALHNFDLVRAVLARRQREICCRAARREGRGVFVAFVVQKRVRVGLRCGHRIRGVAFGLPGGVLSVGIVLVGRVRAEGLLMRRRVGRRLVLLRGGLVLALVGGSVRGVGVTGLRLVLVG